MVSVSHTCLIFALKFKIAREDRPARRHDANDEALLLTHFCDAVDEVKQREPSIRRDNQKRLTCSNVSLWLQVAAALSLDRP